MDQWVNHGDPDAPLAGPGGSGLGVRNREDRAGSPSPAAGGFKIWDQPVLTTVAYRIVPFLP